MIKKITLSNIATFANKTEITELKKVSFFYGSNGSGKTTLSRVLANPDNFSDCSLEWENNQKIKTIVFNEDFIREYFYEKDVLNGIYTMGESAAEIEKDINNKKQELDNLKSKLSNLNKIKEDKENEKNSNFNSFKDNCWSKGYQTLQNDFDEFFTGYKKDKGKFANKILEEKTNSSNLLTIEELKKKYDLIYGKDIQKIEEIILISTESIESIQELENKQSILKVPIIGKKDVDIAKMIEKLHNHDWVKQGKAYYDKNYDENKNVYVCPFCQQETSETFRKQLEEYFDETYQKNINELNRFVENYKETTRNIFNTIENLFKVDNNEYILKEKNAIEDKKEVIEGLIKQNIQLLEKKQSGPSEKIELKSILTPLNEFNEVLKRINENIKKHNSLIENKEAERQNLDKEIWKYIVTELATDIKDYEAKDVNIGKALDSITEKITEIKKQQKEIEKQISDLEKKIKSVKPTVDAINKLLESFGFRGFELIPTADKKHYQVIRDDNSDAKKTLSEGERNFLVFLYFYHFINGVDNPEENINQDKIIVIDDPVSSFDSNVLFIVSTLIRDVINKVRNSNNTIKQIFIFTHNAYFYKEVTFISSRESCYNKRDDTKYYIVRKKDNVSLVESFDTCPIKTSYQLLWDEIKRSEIDCISLQNSMRRIFEFYFKFLANIKEDELLKNFDGIEKNICKSLIAWINVGSHEIIDDFNLSITNEQIESYNNVFRKIFEVTGHIEHYNMMMGINNVSN